MRVAWSPAALLLASMLTARAAAALEPGRRFEQYAHVAWPSVAHASTVYTILPARAGHLWVGTSEGLVRFEGQRLVPFDAQHFPGIVERNVRALHERADGSLWIGSFGRGLARLQGGKVRVLVPGADAAAAYLRALVESADGTMWAGGAGGVVRFMPGRDEAIDCSQGLPHPATRALAIDAADGGLWAGTRAGLARWNGKAWQAEAGPWLAGTAIEAVTSERGGDLWVGTRGAGLWQRRAGTWRSFTAATGLGSNDVATMLRDRGGRLWVATSAGTLAWLDGERFRAFPLAPRMCADRIQALAEDAEGGLWIGTELCGLHRLSERRVLAITTDDGLPSNSVLGLAADRAGNVIVGTRGGGLARLRVGQAPQILRCPPGLPCDECWDFSPSARGSFHFWTVCRQNVVLRWDGQAMRQHQPLPGGLTSASFALEARDGALWFSADKQVVRSHQGVATPLRAQELFEGYRILFEGQGGAMWIAADDGLAVWRAGETRVVRLPTALRPAEVANFHQDAAGTLWMATKGEGIRRLRGEHIATVGVAQGLPTGWIVQLLEDDPDASQGRGARLWASSSKGIFWVDKRELEEVADGRRARLHPALYDASDGVQMRSEPFGHPAGFKDGQGRLWFASNSGITVVDPAAHSRPPPVSIEELRLAGQRVGADGREVRAQAPSDLDVTFAALSFAPADTVSFRYRLRASDRDWVEIGPSRSLHLERLAPGDYQLALQARTRDSGWSANPAALAFTLQPPFHRSPAFLVLIAGAAGLLLLGLHRARLHRTRAGLQVVMAERTRIAREIHDTLAQAFVATSVQLECLEEALEGGPRQGDGKIRRHLASARKVVAESLEEARRALWVLRPQAIEPGLVPALQMLAEQPLGGVMVELQVSGITRPLAPLVASNLLRIAHEGVANAHRHAHARHIELRLAFSPRSVTLSVADDGAGIALPDAGATASAGIGQGILGMKERAAQMGGTLSIETSAGRGTTLRVEVAA